MRRTDFRGRMRGKTCRKGRRGAREGQRERRRGLLVCSQAEGTVCGAWCLVLRTPGLSLLSGPGKNKHTLGARSQWRSCVRVCFCV